jgi:DNA topoisomerase-3
MKLILTEKKDQAIKIAKAMGWRSGRGCYEGTFEGSPVKVVWARGHLVTLKQPREVMPGLTWDDPGLLVPMPNDFQLKVGDDIKGLPVHAQPAHYLKNIEMHLTDQVKEVIIATDADREGEAVGWYILTFLGYSGPQRRAWFAAGLDEKSIKESMSNLRPHYQTKGWFRAAEARGRSDWFYMLLVIAYTYYSKYGKFGPHLGRGDSRSAVMSVGRVQTPALGMIVNRDIEIENFISKDHFKISATFSSGDSGTLKSTYDPVVTQSIIDSVPAGVSWEVSKAVVKDGDESPLEKPLFTGKQEVDDFKSRLIAAKDNATVLSYREGSRKKTPPKTFALTDAQGAVAKACKVSGAIAQIILEDLYEQGWTSYARTSKQDLPNNFYEPKERNSLLDSLKELPSVMNQAIEAADIHNGRHANVNWRPFKPTVFTNKQLEHHGIVPTHQVMTPGEFSNLKPVKKDKGNIIKHTAKNMQDAYVIIAKQFIQALYPAAEYATQNVKFSVPVKDMLNADNSIFTAKGERIVDAGYLTAFSSGADKNTQFPKVSNGDSALLNNVLMDSSKTKPPSRYTEITFPKAMEKVGKDIADPKMRKLLQNSEGIGTPATRKTIVETLAARGYVEVKNETFYSTGKGKDLIKSVPKWLASPENTALWEDYLVQICSQQDDVKAIEMRDDFVAKQQKQLEKLIGNLRQSFDGNLGEKIAQVPTKVTERMKAAINKIAGLKNIKVPSGALTNPVKAKAFLDEHMVKRDPNDNTPSEGQINFVNSLIKNLPEGTIVGENVLTDREECSAFIEKYKSEAKPTEKQVEFAQKLALQVGVDLPEESKNRSVACSKFIDKYKDKVPPTDGQKGFAQKLIDGLPKGTVVPSDVMTNVNSCRAFIDKHKGQKGGKAGAKGATKGRKTPYKK